MQFDILTIFPGIFDSYFNESILGRARQKKLIQIDIHDLRQWTTDKHKTVDDTPYGGGAGMILKIEPIYKALASLKKLSKNKTLLCHPGLDPGSRILDSRFRGNDKGYVLKRQRTILFSAKGKIFTQANARRLAKYDRLILICGRYEGVDERVAEHLADEEISVGQYVLTGGEIPAMILVDSISRLVPGVLGNPESLEEESFQNSKFRIQNSVIEYPQYTKPEIFRKWPVPPVLLSGHHQKIEKWRKNKARNKKCHSWLDQESSK